MVALTGMEASAKSAGQGRPATFYSRSLRKVFYTNASKEKVRETEALIPKRYFSVR
jgi:hypothetical protein